MSGSPHSPRRTGGGFDVHAAAVASKTTHPAVLAVMDPDRDSKLTVRRPAPSRFLRVACRRVEVAAPALHGTEPQQWRLHGTEPQQWRLHAVRGRV